MIEKYEITNIRSLFDTDWVKIDAKIDLLYTQHIITEDTKNSLHDILLNMANNLNKLEILSYKLLDCDTIE